MDQLEKSWDKDLANELAMEFVKNRPKVDHREFDKMKELMVEQGWRIVEIDAGDYSMPISKQEDIVMVERKADDFVTGMIDKSLHLQLKSMLASKPNAMHYLLVVDKTMTEVIASAIERQMYPNQVMGFLGSLISRGFYPIFTGSYQATAKLLDVVRRKVFELESDEVHKPIHHKIKLGGATIITFPGIDEKLGKALVDRFGSIENICKQDTEHLQSVEGVGPKKAQQIYNYLHNNLGEMNRPKLNIKPEETHVLKFKE